MNLQTTYLGLQLRNPLVASASPLSNTAEGLRQLAAGGVGAIVMFSMLEEQIKHEAARDLMLEEVHSESFAESLSYFPSAPTGNGGASYRYLNLLERAVSDLDVPVIASLNGSTTGGWVDFARQLQDAGAHAIELSIYLIPGNTGTTGVDVEERHLEILTGVKNAVSIPVAVKLSPYFSSMGQMAQRLDEAGADGLVMFQRFIQPEIDIESVTVVPGVELSSPIEGRVSQTWIAALRGQIRANLAGTTGVETSDDVVKYLLAGADVAMATSSLLRHGPGYAQTLLDGLADWMSRKGYQSVDEFRGILAVPSETDAGVYGRAGYVSALEKAKRRYGVGM